MRKMKKGNSVLEVTRWFITRQGWEYYLTNEGDGENVRFGLVMGLETEMGSVYLPEVNRHIWSNAEGKELEDVQPAFGWEWEE